MNNLKKLRTEKGYTLKKVATENGLSESQLSFYENGKREPRDKKTWQNLAKYYNVSIAYVMGLTDDPTSWEQKHEEFNKLIDSLPNYPQGDATSKELLEKIDKILKESEIISKRDEPLSPPATINLDKVSNWTRLLIYNYGCLNDENKELARAYISELLKKQGNARKLEL